MPATRRDHKVLFTPGPTEVDPEILREMARPVIGHRGVEMQQLIKDLTPRLRPLFGTRAHDIFLTTCSATGLWEAALRNCVARRVLVPVCGAFSERFYEVALACGLEADPLHVEWGRAVQAQGIADMLATGRYDAVALVHNETATGVVVGDLQPGRPAAEAGLRRGDRIVSIDGVEMTTIDKVFKAIRGSAGVPLRFVIERDGRTFEKIITPIREDNKGMIGFVPTPPMTTRRYGFLEALGGSFSKNLEDASLTFLTLKKLVLRELSLRTFTGPIGLYLASGAMAQEGLVYFLRFIAFVSLQLGIINLFPIPPLDGGHIFTILVEGLIRRDLSARLKERVMQMGLILLLLFMGTIIYLDISKNFFH